MTVKMNKTRVGGIGLVAILICSLYAIQLLFSQGLSPDSYAYLDGAKNLLVHGCFCYDANGLPISLYAPLYSVFLSGVMGVMGIHAFPVLFVNTVLYVLAVLMVLWKRRLAEMKPLEAVLFAFIVSHTMFGYMNNVLSESLFIPLLILWLVLQTSTSFRSEPMNLLAILLLEMSLVSVRYASILLIFAWYSSDVLTRLLSGEKPLQMLTRSRLLRYAVPLAVLAFFMWLRKAVTGSGMQHRFAMGSGKFTLFENLTQFLSDFGTFFTGPALSFQLQTRGLLPLVSLCFLTVFLLLYRVRLGIRLVLFIAISLLLNIFVLWSVRVEDGLNGRYLAWMYIVLFLFAGLERRRPDRALARRALVALTVALLVVNDLYFMYRHTQQSFDTGFDNRIAYYDRFKVGYVKSDTVSNPRYVFEEGKRYLISPCYPWNLPVNARKKYWEPLDE
jgi:hypothetical protein